MIVYRKSSQLRVRRSATPQPPFWFATAIAPYSSRRGSPISIDYLDLRASFNERLEVGVSEDVRDEIERKAPPMAAPVLVEASEFAEAVFRRGEEALALCDELQLPALHLISTRGTAPRAVPRAEVALAAWPLDLPRLSALAADLRGADWGLVVPLLFPVTTELSALERLADLAAAHGARFLAAFPLETDPAAKQALARSLALEQEDEETYAMLFHADLEPVLTATERHVAALASERGLHDFVLPPRWEERSNWNAAVMLTATAARMLAMRHETELAGSLARAARLVAELDKPLHRIAGAASLSIVAPLDEVSVDILSEWLESGRSTFCERINDIWRLRRDAGV